MKCILLTLLSIGLGASLLAQGKYPTPTLTTDGKFDRSVNQYWYLTAAAINRAKSSGITPFEYGKSIGKLFATTWPSTDFDKFISGMLWNLEMVRGLKERQAAAIENPDGSVTLTMDDKVIHDLFSRKPFNVSYEDCLDYWNGLSKAMASDLFKGTSSFEHRDSVLLFTFKKQ